MIKTFACHETKSLFDGQRVWRFASFQSVAMRKLAMLNQAGHVVSMEQLERVPSVCCGGCGG